MRSRQHVVIARLNEEEYHTYEQILKRAAAMYGQTSNKSEQFRCALQIMKGYMVEENRMLYFEYCSDFSR